jgi:fatty acid desaturase
MKRKMKQGYDEGDVNMLTWLIAVLLAFVLLTIVAWWLTFAIIVIVAFAYRVALFCFTEETEEQ